MHKVIPDSVYPYLKVQCGYIPETKLRTQWEVLYWAKQAMTFANIKPFLPDKCRSVVDIGGGMSGIGLFLLDHYGSDCTIYVVDGEGEPKSIKHDEPFSSSEELMKFYAKNGRPNGAVFVDSRSSILCDRPADLIVSFMAWGFHIAPEVYMERVAEIKVGPVILDVRTARPFWLEELDDGFETMGKAILNMPKFDRVVWK
jgi:hypothetical protein